MSPGSITTRIIQFCLSMTGNGREWMEQNPQDKLPNDYIKYPGKMDHATCVTMKVTPSTIAVLTLQVGKFDLGVPRKNESTKTNYLDAMRGQSSRTLKESL